MNKTKKVAAQLRLVRDVVRNLTPSELGAVQGGVPSCAAPSNVSCRLPSGWCPDGISGD